MARPKNTGIPKNQKISWRDLVEKIFKDYCKKNVIFVVGPKKNENQIFRKKSKCQVSKNRGETKKKNRKIQKKILITDYCKNRVKTKIQATVTQKTINFLSKPCQKRERRNVHMTEYE